MIGRYRLLQQIGEGGFGVVFMAEQTEPVQRKVALKVIKAGMDTREVIARFEAERQALALMDHPNIARVLDGGTTASRRPYFVMELVRGIPITDYCDQAMLSTRERLELFIKVCRAVQHAHQKGVIHRDLKPSNVLVTLHDGEAVPKVIDFGVAKALGQKLTEKTLFTRFEQMIGTPVYMSPEQAALSGLDIDTRSDIYSLGVLLYELLTGVTPLDAELLRRGALDEIRRRICETDPPTPSTRLQTMGGQLAEVARCRHAEPAALSRLVRGDLDWITMKCLEKDRTRRYETANGLAMDVQRYLSHEPVLARSPGNLYRFQKLVRRNKLVFAATAGIMAALTAGMVVSLLLWAREKHSRTRADTEASKSRQIARLLTATFEGVGPSVAKGRDKTLLQEIIDKTAGQLDRELTNQPEVGIELRATLADVYGQLGFYDKMEAMARRELELARAHFSPVSAQAARALDQIGTALWSVGKLTPAEEVDREALRVRTQLFGENSAEVATSQTTLAIALWDEGKFPEAELLARRALAIRQKLFGAEHADVAQSLNLLGLVLYQEGKLVESEPIVREALAMRRKLFGEESIATVNSLNNLAGVLLERGKLADTEAAHREVLRIRRKLLGESHPQVAQSLGNVAWVLRREGRLAEAESLDREALALRRKIFGAENPEVAASISSLSEVLRDQGKLTESEELARAALDMDTKLLGQQNFMVPTCLVVLASVLERADKLDQAEQRYREALEFRTKLPNADPAITAGALRGLATVLCAEGKASEAEPPARESVELDRKRLPDAPAAWADGLRVLAEVLLRKHNFDAARTLFDDVLTPTLRSEPDCAELLHARAELFARQGQWQAAITNLDEAMQRAPGNSLLVHDRVLLAAQTADLESYRTQCQRETVLFVGTNEPILTANLALDCLLIPDPALEAERTAGWADTALAAGTNYGAWHWFELAKGLTEYRRGRFTKAVEWLKAAQSGQPAELARESAASLVLALAESRLGLAAAAASSLALGKAYRAKLPNLTGGDLGKDWRKWVIVQVLSREAESSAGVSQPSSGSPR